MSTKPKKSEIQKVTLKTIEPERLSDRLSRRAVYGEKGTIAEFTSKSGSEIVRHNHVNEEISMIVSGALKYVFDDREVVAKAGDIVVVPPNVPHKVISLEDSVFIDYFAPPRDDYLRGEDTYLRM